MRGALRLGFRSRKIDTMGSVSALNDAVMECISWIAGSSKDGVSPEHLVAVVRDRLQIETDEMPEKPPSLTTNDGDLNIQQRCGRSLEALRRKAKFEVLIRWLYDVEEPRGKYITSSFVQRAVLHAFFGHDIQSRDKVAIDHRQSDDSGSEDRVQAGDKTAPCDSFPELARSTPTGTSDTPHSVISISSTIADFKPSTEMSVVLSPRNEESGSQKSLAEMITMLRNSTESGTCNPGNNSSVSASCSVEATCSSPTMDQAGENSVIRGSHSSSPASIESTLSNAL